MRNEEDISVRPVTRAENTNPVGTKSMYAAMIEFMASTFSEGDDDEIISPGPFHVVGDWGEHEDMGYVPMFEHKVHGDWEDSEDDDYDDNDVPVLLLGDDFEQNAGGSDEIGEDEQNEEANVPAMTQQEEDSLAHGKDHWKQVNKDMEDMTNSIAKRRMR